MTLQDIIADPDRRKRAQEEQEALRERHGHRLAKRPAQANYLFGASKVQMVLDQLTAISDGLLHADEERRTELYNQLAEGYALQGMFEEAASVSLDERYKLEYRAKAQAMRNIGVRQCDCPEETVHASPTDAKGTVVQTQTPTEEVWDARRQLPVTLVRCAVCGRVSARL